MQCNRLFFASLSAMIRLAFGNLIFPLIKLASIFIELSPVGSVSLDGARLAERIGEEHNGFIANQ